MDQSGFQVIGNRYRLLRKLGQGGMGQVFLAYDQLHQQEVALKRMIPENIRALAPSNGGLDTTESSVRIALAHEFQTLASLRHPHLISVMDYGFDAEQQPYFTMRYLENARSILDAGFGKPLQYQFELIIELLQALAYVHRRGIIHRDLKPDNALVNAEGEVKVLDFGLALLNENKAQEDMGLSGTLAFMAPELLTGESVSISSDLYAVGIIAYMMMTGELPFDETNMGTLIGDIMNKPVPVEMLDVPFDLVMVLERLVEKSPEDRYHDAYEVINDICDALQQPVPPETRAIRESFLQAAKFVARNEELGHLKLGLTNAVNGNGNGWLVGGESGVGKSRMVEELRIQALVKGALVMNGQAVQETDQAYEIWREPLRRLALAVDLTDTEASVIKEWVPDLETILDRPVPDAPVLEGNAGQRRLNNIILGLFRKYQQPALLILEDLQWSSEGMELLKALMPIMQESPLMVVGTFRDDERPDLPDEFPEMQVIKLGRLSEDGIAKLSKSMLGDIGTRPEVINFLKQESEGNVFFLVEIVRALAEQAGRLSLVGSMELPTHIMAGGIQNVINHRLEMVPEHDRYLLRLAAVAGRQIDLDLLKMLAPSIDLDDWLDECSNAAVIEAIDDQWRFSHDKIRQGLLGILSDSEKVDLHKQVADTILKIYADKANEYAEQIAEHYEQAGEMLDAAQWFGQAGHHARETYAPGAAIQYYRTSLKLWEEYGEGQSMDTATYADISLGLASMLTWRAEYTDALRAYESVRDLTDNTDDINRNIRARLGIVSVLRIVHDYQQALENLNAIDELLARQDIPEYRTKAAYMKGWTLFETGDMDGARKLGEEVVAISEKLNAQASLADGLNLVSVIDMVMGNFAEATEKSQRSLEIYNDLGDRAAAISTINNLGSLALDSGNFAEAARRYEEALEGARTLGHRDAEIDFLTNLGGALARNGDYDDAVVTIQSAMNLANHLGISLYMNAYYYLAEAYLGMDDLSEAYEYGLQALEMSIAEDSVEELVASWRIMGQIAAYARRSTNFQILQEILSNGYDPARCFEESVNIAADAGMEGERARGLREWGRYESKYGDKERGLSLWNEALDTFRKLNAIHEVNRMESNSIV